MATKTARVTDQTGTRYFTIPCDTNYVANTGLTVIPANWIEITEQVHRSNVTPCLAAKVLEIYCYD